MFVLLKLKTKMRSDLEHNIRDVHIKTIKKKFSFIFFYINKKLTVLDFGAKDIKAFLQRHFVIL